MRKVNISIDDVSPHPASSIRVTEQCLQILEKVPTAKFTLFVPTAYWRTIPSPPQSKCERPLFLSAHPDFCDALRALPSEHFEIGFHGHHHGIPGTSNNDELRYVTLDDARSVYEAMMKEVDKAGLVTLFKRILRPPAWRLSPGAFDAAADYFDLLALNPGSAYEEIYAGRQHSDTWASRIVYQDASPPNVPFPEKWDSLEIVTHACEWDRNFLSKDLADDIINLMIEQNAVGSFIGSLRGQV